MRTSILWSLLCWDLWSFARVVLFLLAVQPGLFRYLNGQAADEVRESYKVSRLETEPISSSVFFNDFAVDKHGRIFMCTEFSLYHYDGERFWSAEEMFPGVGELQGLSYKTISVRDSILVVGLRSGVLLLNIKTGKLVRKIDFSNKHIVTYAGFLKGSIIIVLNSGFIYNMNDKTGDVSLKDTLGRVSRVLSFSDSSFYMHKTNGDLMLCVSHENRQNYRQIANNLIGDVQLYTDFNGKLTKVRSADNSEVVFSRSADLKNPIMDFNRLNSFDEIPENSYLLQRFMRYDNNTVLALVSGCLYIFSKVIKDYESIGMGVRARALHMWPSGQVLISSEDRGLVYHESIKDRGEFIRPKFCSYGTIPLKGSRGVYILSMGYGICYFDLNTKSILTARHGTKGLTYYGFRQISGDSLFLLYGNNISYFNTRSGVCEVLYKSFWVREIGLLYGAYHVSGSYWILGTPTGVYICDMKLRKYRLLFRSNCRFIIPANENTLLCGNAGEGLIMLNVKTLSWDKINLNGLSSQASRYVFSILPMYGNYHALGTIDGLYRINLKLGKAWRYNTSNAEFNTASLGLFNGRYLLAGGLFGVDVVDISSISRQVNPEIEICVNSLREFNGSQSTLRKYYYPVNKLDVSGGADGVVIKMACNIALTGQRFLWRYKVEGHNDSWIESDVISKGLITIYLAQMPAGNYKLHVQVRSTVGNWTPSQVYELNVSQVWYRTWWFITLVVFSSLFLVVLIAFFYYRRSRKRMMDKNRALQLEKDLALNRLKALRNQINPHMLANSLQTIQYYIHVRSKDEASDYVDRYGKLMRQTFDKGARDYISISEEIEYLNRYAELEILKSGGDLSFSISVDPGLNEKDLLIPSMLLQPLVENAFKYGGVSPVDGKRTIWVMFVPHSERYYEVTVFNSSSLEKPEVTHKDYSGIGVVRERLKLMSIDAEVRENLTISSEPYGVTVSVIIPRVLQKG